MANRRVPKFSLTNCVQTSKTTFMCPKFCTNPVLKYTKCHISTNLSSFLKLCLLYCQKLFALAPTNRRFTEKNRLRGNTVGSLWNVGTIIFMKVHCTLNYFWKYCSNFWVHLRFLGEAVAFFWNDYETLWYR